MDIIELGKAIDNKEDILSYDYFQTEDSYKKIGNKSSDFEILKLLGSGAFGKVYKVKSKINKRIYAMKIFDKNIELIKKNLKINISHIFMIKIYNYFEEDGKLYIIMEYMNNGSLKDYIIMNQNNILEEEQILSFLFETIWCLYTIHQSGYFLQNIKPENILIDDNLKLKFGEFLSTITPIEGNKDIKKEHPYKLIFGDETTNQVWKRTKKYLSSDLKGPKADVYSLGLVLKELLTKEYYSNNMNKVVRSISEKDSINEQTLENAFITISNLFFEKQKNSSFESIVLCLKSFSNFSELLTKEKTKNNIMTKFVEIVKFITTPNSNFYNWNLIINELRMEFMKRINEQEIIDEVDPCELYLYLVNIIINEVKNPIIIKKIAGSIRAQLNCTICNQTQYPLNNYVLLEINPNDLLKKQINDGKKPDKIRIDQLLNTEAKIYKDKIYKDNIFCSKCNQKTEHNCKKEIISYPDSLVISLKYNVLDDIQEFTNMNLIDIPETIKLKVNEKPDEYELIALLKVSRKNKNILYYSFSKFNRVWFLSQRYKGIEQVEMNDSHRRSKNVRMIFYQRKNMKN